MLENDPPGCAYLAEQVRIGIVEELNGAKSRLRAHHQGCSVCRRKPRTRGPATWQMARNGAIASCSLKIIFISSPKTNRKFEWHERDDLDCG